MAADFVPFLASISARAGTPAPAPVAAPAAAFAPIAPSAAPAQKPVCPPGDIKVDLKREGDRVTLIRIQCRCGDVIELDCDYQKP